VIDRIAPRFARYEPPRLVQDDLIVRVPAKMLLHLPFERRDLFVEGGQYGRDRAGGGRVRDGDDTGSRPTGWSCWLRSTAWMRVVLVSRSRRRACLSAARIWLRFSCLRAPPVGI